MKTKLSFFPAILLIISFFLPINATIKVGCVGNSVTFGATIEDRENNSYPAQLQRMLGSEYIVKNFGKSGATLLEKGHRPYIKQEEYKASLDFKADIVVIHLGLNDTDPRNWPNYRKYFVCDYLKLINSYKEKNKKAKIYICRLSPIFDGHPRFKSGTYIWYHQIQNEIEKVARFANLQIIDINEDLASRPDLLPDNIHPNKEGAKIIAQRVYSSITGDFGGLQLSEIFSDNMVLQREKPLLIKGRADANSEVQLEFGNIHRSTKSDFQGHWLIELPSMQANKIGKTLSISSKNKVCRFENVVVGDVWLCSGQSNMEFLFRQSENYTDKKNSINSAVRLFHMKPVAHTNNSEWDTTVLQQVNNLKYFKQASWVAQNVSDNAEFSAIGIIFGSILADSLDVPIGLIQNAVGGSPQEAWISRPFLEKNPALVDVLSDFYSNDRIQGWCRGRAKKNTALSNNKQQRHPYQPAYLYESGIKPLNQFPIKGMIWYQGESNAHNAEYYKLLFHSFTENVRNEWGRDTPLIYAQLSSMDRPGWPYFRAVQNELQSEIDNIYMVVTSDLGDSLDVHPKQKYLVGERMSKVALANVYNKRIEFSGPSVQHYQVDKKDVLINFNHGNNLQPSYGDRIVGFEIMGEDGYYYPAQVTDIQNNTLRISSNKVQKPIALRYAWQPFTRANLINKEQFPASTFEIKIK